MTPFIIWTVQRTGGTNFATNLIRLGGFPITDHEPLNIGRSYGRITQDWKDTRDREQLDKSIGAFLDKGYAIKHCVENVDWPINGSLLQASLERGFSHLLLYRESSIDRLLSLHFALETGLWGRKKVSAAKASMGNAFDTSLHVKGLNIDNLIDHENHCNDLLMRVARQITDAGAILHAISFEDIYESDNAVCEGKIKRLLEDFRFPDSGGYRELLSHVRNVGDQGSKDLYSRIDGYEKIHLELSRISRLKERLLGEFPDIFI